MERALPTGRLQIHSEPTGIVNPSKKKEGVSEITKKLNTANNLKQTFHDTDNPRVLHNVSFADGSQVNLYNQTGKYSELSALVIAKGPKTFDTENKIEVPTETIYDYPFPVQEAYWQQILATMAAFKKHTSIENMRVFAGENCVATFSNDEHRTSRSIANPHTHIVGFIEDHVNKDDMINQFPNLSKENTLINELSPEIVSELQEQLPSDIKENIHFNHRTELPSGYTFILDGNLEEQAAEPKEFARIMEEHHKAYTRVVKEIENIDENKIIPQPSYRLYLEHANGKTYASISPEIISHAGVMEAAGVLLDRNEENPQRLDQEFIDQVQKKVAEDVQLATYDKNEKEPPFINSLRMEELKDEVFQKAEAFIDAEVTPEGKNCFVVNKELKKALIRKDLHAEYLEHEDPSNRGIISHAFVNAQYEGNDYLLDLQYKQFVPEDKRDEVSDYLAIKYTTKQDVITGLTEHKIPDKYHEYWTEELFPSTEQPSLFTTNASSYMSGGSSLFKN